MREFEVDGKIPRGGNGFSRWLGRTVLGCAGWRIEGKFPDEPKIVAVVAPHTSNWDFVYGMAAKFAISLRASWMAKHSLFWPPLGWVLRYFGGVPINRTASHGVVEEIARAFIERDQLVMGVTPEGTRRQVTEWKTGFYRIAERAKIPIAMVYLDYENKVLGFGPSFLPSGDIDTDMHRIKEYFRQFKGKHEQTIP